MRPFEAKVKLWVSKFIFFHADSGIGLKHKFEAVFEAIRGRFVIKKPVSMGSRRCKGLIFYVAGSFYATVFMSMFLRPKLRKKLRSLEAMEAA